MQRKSLTFSMTMENKSSFFVFTYNFASSFPLYPELPTFYIYVGATTPIIS